MTNMKLVLFGTGSFLIGLFYVLLSQHIFPPLIAFLGSDLQDILWFGVIITWILALIVVPIGFFVFGLKEENEKYHDISGLIVGILFLVFSLGIVYVTWYWNVTFTASLEDNFLLILYWIGYLSVWLFNIIIVPTYLIINSKQTS